MLYNQPSIKGPLISVIDQVRILSSNINVITSITY